MKVLLIILKQLKKNGLEGILCLNKYIPTQIS